MWDISTRRAAVLAAGAAVAGATVVAWAWSRARPRQAQLQGGAAAREAGVALRFEMVRANGDYREQVEAIAQATDLSRTRAILCNDTQVCTPALAQRCSCMAYVPLRFATAWLLAKPRSAFDHCLCPRHGCRQTYRRLARDLPARLGRPALAIDIGSAYGHTTDILARALRQRGDCRHPRQNCLTDSALSSWMLTVPLHSRRRRD